MRPGQAMLETVLAVLFITFLLLGCLWLSRLLVARQLLDHAAARAARAKAVGLNDFMCVKAARVAIIPVAGERLTPKGISGADEVGRLSDYMNAEDESYAAAILDYKWWPELRLDVSSGFGVAGVTEVETELTTDEWSIDGRAAIETHFPYYMYDQGL